MSRFKAVAAALIVIAAVCAGVALAGGRGAPARRGSARAPAGAASIATAGPGLSARQVQAAYNVLPLLRKGIDGAGQTIVIVDSFGSPTIAHDLARFDQAFGLPAPPSLRVIQPDGPVPAFTPTSSRAGWAAETTMDVEWAHVMAPGARIVLVETPVAENEGTSGFPQIVAAEKYVIGRHLGGVISMSFGATEETFPSAAALENLRSAFTMAAEPRYDVTLVAGSGDEGASGYTYSGQSDYPARVIGWPASDPLVTAVGGTQLDLTAGGQRRKPDVAWNDSGGGLSSIFSRPSYQDSVRAVTGGRRGIPDISMDASCVSGTSIYESFTGQGSWQLGCGTSLATPLFAGIVALADQVAGRPLGPINPALYAMAHKPGSGIVDVTSGSNTVTGPTFQVPGFSAGKGYDLVTGLGTVNAAVFVPALAAAAGGKRR